MVQHLWIEDTVGYNMCRSANQLKQVGRWSLPESRQNALQISGLFSKCTASAQSKHSTSLIKLFMWWGCMYGITEWLRLGYWALGYKLIPPKPITNLDSYSVVAGTSWLSGTERRNENGGTEESSGATKLGWNSIIDVPHSFRPCYEAQGLCSSTAYCSGVSRNPRPFRRCCSTPYSA